MRFAGEFVYGWRKTGTAWLILLWIFTITLFTLLLVAYRRVGSLSDAVIFEGDCGRSSTDVLLLRLAVNAVATVVTTSSTFFLQLLTAPSRGEIDRAHSRARWMNIGILSPWNLRFMPRWRAVLWLAIVLTSLPFHLLFNSTVYGTDAANEIVILLASEGFLQGGDYFLPGIGWEFGPQPDYFLEVEVDTGDLDLFVTFDYQALETETGSMAQSASTWQRLDGPDCYDAYNSLPPNSVGLTDRQSLVIILESPENNTGWKTTDVYDGATSGNTTPPPENGTIYTVWYTDLVRPTSATPCCSQYFPDRSDLQGSDSWSFNFTASSYDSSRIMQADYCLSQQTVGSCKTVASVQLLLALFLFAVVKSAFCTAALCLLWHSNPLSTIDDAVESFIRSPDLTTEGMCTFGRRDITMVKRRVPTWTIVPRQWKLRQERAASAVPPSTWIVVYGLSGAVLVTASGFFFHDVSLQFWDKSSFGATPTNPDINYQYYNPDFDSLISTLVGASLFANLPQLLISTLYILFSGLVARLSMAREWALLSKTYRPLRVTKPQGQQLGSYFLQIPLVWAIPLQAMGVLLHFLASNSIYIEVGDLATWDPTHVARNFVVRWSMQATLTTICVFIAAISIPLLLGFFRLPGPIPAAGNCSAAISAACHVVWEPSALPRAPMQSIHVSKTELTTATDSGLLDAYVLADQPAAAIVDGALTEWDRRLRGKLKWGVVADNVARFEFGDGQEIVAGHLSFGTEDDYVAEPVAGLWYAGFKC